MQVRGRVSKGGEFTHEHHICSDTVDVLVNHSRDMEFWLRVTLSRDELTDMLAEMDQNKAFDEAEEAETVDE